MRVLLWPIGMFLSEQFSDPNKQSHFTLVMRKCNLDDDGILHFRTDLLLIRIATSC
jgi:hypothetical protein